MAGFGLQFLDGVGDAYNQPVFRTYDYENSGMVRFTDGGQYNHGENAYYEQTQDCRCDYRNEDDSDKTSGLLKALIIFGIGMVAGQGLRKLFKD